MLNFVIALMFGLASKPQPQVPAASNWVTIGTLQTGTTLQADTASFQKSADQRALSLRVVHDVPTRRGIKSSSFFVWMNCRDRSFRTVASRDDDVRGKSLVRRSYDSAGKGFEKVKPGSAVAIAMTAVCD